MEIVSGIRLKNIFLDNQNWWQLVEDSNVTMREAIVINVIKMLICRTDLLGYHLYICPHCHTVKKVPHSCKSRFCSSCGKKATDQWIKKNMAVLPDTTWQHITFTMPDKLWELFWLNRSLFNSISSITANIIQKIAHKKGALVGIYTAIHTFGRDLKRNVHVHLSVTRGGLNINDHNKWVKDVFFHLKAVEPQWRYHIIKMFREEYKKGNLKLPKYLNHIKNLSDFNSWLNVLYEKTWVVHFNARSENKKHNIDYLGKYLKRPPIGETRIKQYDGKNVTFEYLDHYTDSKKLTTLPVRQFITKLITHIPDTNFRCIRYYGFLANRVRGKLLPIVHTLLKNPHYNSDLYQKIKVYWAQLIQQTFGIDPLKCTLCKQAMELSTVVYSAKISLISLHRQIACNEI